MEFKELDKKKIGSRIRLRREMLKISRDELAKELGITPKFLADIEYGEKGVSLKSLYKIMQALNLSADYILIGDESNMPTEEKRRVLSENILGSLSVCSVEQLGCMEQIARLYVEGIVNKE